MSNAQKLIDLGYNASDACTISNKYTLYCQKKKARSAQLDCSFRTRDSQKTKTYRGEWSFEKDYKDEIIRFDNPKMANAYLKKVLRSKTWEKLGGGQSVNLIIAPKQSRRFMGFCSYRGDITLFPNGMNEYVLLHELTHALGHMHHDVYFRRDLLKLVSRFIGRIAAQDLKAKWKDLGLKVNETVRIQEFDKWFTGYIRMEKLREKKVQKNVN